MTRSPWWYGVSLFPIVLLTRLLIQFASRTSIIHFTATGDPNFDAVIASLLLRAVLFWGGTLIAVVVLICLVVDLRTLRADDEWAPSLAWGVAGIAHLVGTEVTGLLALSTPALAVYLYRRHLHVGNA